MNNFRTLPIFQQYDDYYNYLANFKGYSDFTCKTYCRYAHELVCNELDYFRVLNNHQNTCNNTKRVIISAIKKYYEYIKDERMHELKLPRKEKNLQEYLSYDDYKKMLRFFKYRHTINTQEIILLIRVLFETGIRANELLNIKRKDVFEDKIKINGKNNKQRFVYLDKQLLELIRNTITNDEDKVFPYSYKNLYKKILRAGRKSIQKNISPHMFRRGFATYCSENNIDIFELCHLMGHENINTTKMYIKKEVNGNLVMELFKNSNGDI